MKNSEIRKKYLEYKNYVNDINGLNKDAKIVLSDNINIINKLIDQFETLFGQDYDSIKDAIEDSKELQKKFVELTDEIGNEKVKLDELNVSLEDQRKNFKITADEQKRCLEYASKIKKIGAAQEFEEASKKLNEYKNNSLNLTQDEVDRYEQILEREKQLQNSLGIRNDKQREYIRELTESNGTLNDTLDKYYELESTNDRITQNYKEQLRLKVEEDKISKRRGKMFDNYLKILKGAWGIIKNWSSEWMTFNDLTIKSGRAIGMSNANLRNYNLKLIKDTVQLSHLYGITREQWLGFQNAYAESTSKAIVLTQGELENIGAVSKLTSDEIVNQAVNNMDTLGGSSDNAMAQVAMTHQRAMLLGLNASKLAKDTVKNWSLAQKFNFRNGVDGISRMTALSERLKFNLESIANVAENMQSIEGSIQTTARLQMLGGQFARNFSNPMDVMFESNYDLEGLTKRITDTFAGQGVFNSKTGKVDISPINQRFIREASKALGISFDEAINMATQNVKYDKVMSEVNPLSNFDENQKESIANLAKWDSEKKEHYVTIQTEEGETKNVAIKDLTAEQIDAARSLEANTVDINKNVYDINNGVKEILNIAKERASDQRSMIEKLLGIKESFKGIKANSTDWYMHPTDNFLNSTTKRDGYVHYGLETMRKHPLLSIFGAVGGYTLLKGLIAYKFRKFDGSITQAFKNYVTTRRTASERNASGTGSSGGASGSSPTPKKGFFNRVGGKLKSLTKLGKGTKYGLLLAGAGALWYGLSSFTNKPVNGDDTINPDLNKNDVNDTQLTELKKQTSLLKDISENKAVSQVTYYSDKVNNPNITKNTNLKNISYNKNITDTNYIDENNSYTKSLENDNDYYKVTNNTNGYIENKNNTAKAKPTVNDISNTYSTTKSSIKDTKNISNDKYIANNFDKIVNFETNNKKVKEKPIVNETDNDVLVTLNSKEGQNSKNYIVKENPISSTNKNIEYIIVPSGKTVENKKIIKSKPFITNNENVEYITELGENIVERRQLEKAKPLVNDIEENRIVNKNIYRTDENNNSVIDKTTQNDNDEGSIAKDLAISAGTFAGYMALDKGTSYLAKNGQKMSQQGGFIGKIGKIGLKASPKLLRGFSLGGLAVDGLNFVGKTTGLYEEGSTTDKLMNIGSSALTGAGIGSIAGPIGSAVGAVIGAGVGVVSEYGENIKKWFTKSTNKAKLKSENLVSTQGNYNFGVKPMLKTTNYYNSNVSNVGLNRTLEAPLVQSIPVVGQPTQIIKETYRETVTDKIIVPDINLNLNGTIKLTSEGGKNTNIDIEKLLNNQQFKNMLIKMVKDGLDKNQNNGKIDRNGLSNMRVSSGYANK